MEEGLLADVTGLSMPSLLQENEDLSHVLDVLCAGGYGAWVVGGAVRDSLLGKSHMNMIFALLQHQMKSLSHLMTLYRLV